jgi:CDP-diacylglycerol--glycerol-3-phosphate 3-phosphatidyltransferase
MPSIDLLSTGLVLALLATGVMGYCIRLFVNGSAHYSRVNAAGSSPLLGRGAMEFGYWCLQPFGRACIAIGLSPNQITGLSLLFGAAGGVAIAWHHLGVGALLAAISGLGDVLDGLVARETKRSNPGGAIFDASVDRYTEFFILGGIAFAERESGFILALALLGILGSFMISYGSAKAEALRITVPSGSMRRAERATYLCGGLLFSPITGFYAAQGSLPEWAAQAPMLAALTLVAVLSNVSAVVRLLAIARGSRSLSLGGRPSAIEPKLVPLESLKPSPIEALVASVMPEMPAKSLQGAVGAGVANLHIHRTAHR